MLKKLLLLLLVIFSVSLVACSPITPGGTVHAAPVACLALDNNIVGYRSIPAPGLPMKAGDTITVAWKLYQVPAQAYTTQPPPPQDRIQQSVMQEQLFGPFTSLAAIQQLQQAGNNPVRTPLVASSQPIVTNGGCVPKNYSSLLHLPKDLKPGYYDLYISGTSVYASGSAGSSSDVPILVS